MDATSARWSQGIGVLKSREEKKAIRAQKQQALNCPRCNSSHTKFCYYNNYNLSQPRYFCKSCRRYWTAGGSLRNVPVGGASRSKTNPSSSSSSSSSSKLNHHHHHMTMTQVTQPSSSSNLVSQNHNQHMIQNTGGDQDHLMGIFKSTGNDYARGMMMINSFMPMPVAPNSSNTINTTLTASSTSARLFFPFENFKPPSPSSTSDNQVQGVSSCSAYWIGEGSWSV